MAGSSESPGHLRDEQSGVSLVEIVIAMFLLALMSVAVLPLVVGAAQASTANRDLLAATTLAGARLATLQAAFPNSTVNSCATVVATAAAAITDPSGGGATASISFGPCPSSYPSTVAVTVKGFRPRSTTAAITLDSAILVSAA
ncbi:MAG TPA: prepilin-type N-terminal cleavage/methylation domain-containing protein [Propionicimonas sp.]|uniref:prepilin-type N-terminal cleavage/methylation domain-containing protein n=1 Tax=Propionicimonas sp. TaxID=1955623 RepID=UPI002F42737E